MAENRHSTDGLAEDLIRSFVQMSVVEMHIKSLIEKKSSEMAEGMVDPEDTEAVLKYVEELTELENELVTVAQLRRDDMLYLYRMYGAEGDKKQWCLVKHYGIAMMTAFEVYQASDNDAELQFAYLEKNKLFTKALSKFLGVGITECAACFADMLKGD